LSALHLDLPFAGKEIYVVLRLSEDIGRDQEKEDDKEDLHCQIVCSRYVAK
jgi:hypothetical protein